MPQKKRIFDLFHPITDERVLRGTAAECAAFFGVALNKFYSFKNNKKQTYRGYRVELVQDVPPKDVCGDKDLMKAAKKWDEFCEPIREEFGIPVYRPEMGVQR